MSVNRIPSHFAGGTFLNPRIVWHLDVQSGIDAQEAIVKNMSHNTERVDFRATSDVKQLIEKAASIMGLDVSSFLRATIVPAAQQVVDRHEARVLTNRDRDRFLAILDQAEEPNQALRAASERFRDRVERGEIQA